MKKIKLQRVPISLVHCICIADQYGCATNPDCLLHGSNNTDIKSKDKDEGNMVTDNWKYIIKGEGRIALPVHSSMQFHEMQEYIRINSKKLHPKGNDKIFMWGTIEIVNPMVMTIDTFADWCPALIEVRKKKQPTKKRL